MLSRYATALLALIPFTASAQTEVEPNNTTATANALTLGTPMTGIWCSGDAADIFSFTTAADGYLQVAFDASHTDTQINVFLAVRLLDANGVDVDGATTTSGPSDVVEQNAFNLYCLAQGTYYIQVSGSANNECNDYTLTAALVQPAFGNDSEPNNSNAQAQLLSEGVFADGRVNYSYGGDNTDWFRFSAPGDGQVNLQLDAFNQNAGSYGGNTLELFDASLNSIVALTFTAGSLFVPDTAFNSYTQYCVGEGTYYLHVTSGTMCGMSYRLRWDFITPAFDNDNEPNNSNAQAQVLAQGTFAEGHVNYSYIGDNSDWFRFDTPSDGQVALPLDAFNQNAGSYGGNTLELYDGALNILNTYTFVAGGLFQPDTAFNTFTRYCLSQGTYYLHVTAGTMCGMSYRLKWVFTAAPYTTDAEDNDVLAQALPVLGGVQHTGHINFDVGDDNSDWYFFSVAVDGSPNIALEAAHQNGGTYAGTLEWYNGSGTAIGTASYSIGGDSNSSPSNYTPGPLTAGNYFFRITSPVCGLSYRFTMSGVSTVGVDEHTLGSMPITVAPNPSADGLFTLRTSFTATRVQLTDIGGRVLRDERVGTNGGTILLDASALPPGTYMARLSSADGRWLQVPLVRVR